MKKSNVFYMQTKPCPFTAYIEQRAEYDLKTTQSTTGMLRIPKSTLHTLTKSNN